MIQLKRRRRARIALALALALLALGTAAAMWYRATRVRSFTYNLQPLSEQAYAQLVARAGWRAESLEVEPGIRLRGLSRTPSNERTPYLLFWNGNDAHPLATGQQLVDALRAGDDWGATVWAYRGFDGNPGAPEPHALADDAWKAYLRLTQTQAVSAARVHVIGFSLGTSVATALVARAATHPPASLSLLGPLTEIDMVMPGGHPRQRYRTLDALDAIRVPVLVVHGHDDSVLPVEWGRRIARRLHASYLEPPNVGHLDLISAKTVLTELRRFILRAQLTATRTRTAY